MTDDDFELSTTEKIDRNRYIEKQERQSKPTAKVDENTISSVLLENEPQAYFTDYEPPVDKDYIKANVNADELSATRINAIQSSLLGYYGKLLEMDLTPTQLFHQHVISIINNSSRGKGGWAGYLAKTSKSVSETTLVEKANEIQNNKPKGIFDRLKGK